MYKLLKTDPAKRATICLVSVEEILNLRHRLLREGLPLETARFEGDDRTYTWHFGLYHPLPPEEKVPVICCASFMFEPYKSAPAWRLRGMATDPQHQGVGFGALLLETAEKAIFEDSGTGIFWCNARVPAVRFYEKQGWKVDSEEFDIPTAGPHRKMAKQL